MKRADWKVLICVLGSTVLASCGTPGVPIPPALELAKPVTDLRATRKGEKVYLAWTVPSKTTDHQTVRHPGRTRVCRSLKAKLQDCQHPVAEIPPAQFQLNSPDSGRKGAAQKVEATYIDTLPHSLQEDPTAQITYAIAVLNESGRSAGFSNTVEVPSAQTLSPPSQFSAEVKSDGVLLSWECQPISIFNPALGYKLRIYRREEGKENNVRLGDLNFTDCSGTQSVSQSSGETKTRRSQFLDQSFEWEKHYDYRATTVTVIAQSGKAEVEVEGDDTPTIQVFAHDTFPPAVPTGLQAVFSGVGQAPFVDLVWSPNSEADLAGYDIFRREEGGQPLKLNLEPVKTPAYRDTNVQSGKQYFYSVSAVDERNNESARSEEASEQIP